MAIVSTITLKDNYTPTAKKIESSMSGVMKAMNKVETSSSKTGKAMEKAFGKKHKVNIDDVKCKQVRKQIKDLDSNLKKTVSKPYQIRIEAKAKRMDFKAMVKGGVSKLKNDINSAFNTFKGKAIRFKTDLTGIVKAKREAKRLSKLLSQTSGERHKIKIDFNKSSMGFLDRIKQKLLSLKDFKIGNLFSGGLGGLKGALSGGVKGAGGGMGGIISGMGAGGMAALGAGIAGAGALAAGTGAMLKSGFNRLSDIQTSKAKLKGLGYGKGDVNTIMGNALSSVKGTSFGMGEAAQTAAGAVAAGIKPGKQLESMLKSVSNSAAAAGVGMDEMGSIFNKVVTSNRAQSEELNQVADRGIPIYQSLGEVMGVSASEVKKLASQGKIDYATFQKGMEKASGNVAGEQGNTVQGAWSNLKASVGRMGAGFLGGKDGESGIFGKLAPAINGVIEKLGPLETVAGNVGEKIGSGLMSAIDTLAPVFSALGQAIAPLGSLFMSFASAVGPIVVAGFQALGSIISTYIVPIIQSAAGIISGVVSVIQSTVIPVVGAVASVISGVVIPGFKTLISAALTPVKAAFSALKTVISTVASAFRSIKSAIGDAVGSLRGIGSRISSAITGFLGGGGGGKGHATGTGYFEGGWTRINERGEELIQLARGARIYPAGKTNEIIQRDVRRSTNKENDAKVIHYAPVITINGANKSDAEITDMIDRKLRRLAVNV